MEHRFRDIEHDLSHIDPGPEEKPPKKRSPYWLIWVAAVLSLFVHLGLFFLGIFMPENHIADIPERAPPPMRARLVPPPSPRMAQEKNKQVVKIAPPAKEVAPEKPDYLAEYNSSTKEQTRARETNATSPNVGTRSAQPAREARRSEPAPKVRQSDNGLLAKKPELPPLEKLMPTWKSGGDNGAQSNDYLKNVQVDNDTKLNTAQWEHAAFFNRMKDAIARRWNPNRAIRRYDPTGVLVKNQDRLTGLLATIDRDGKLIDIKVVKQSGVYYLDDEALNAFKEAAPFSNPPKALFASADTFNIHYGFNITFDRGVKFDLDWKPY